MLGRRYRITAVVLLAVVLAFTACTEDTPGGSTQETRSLLDTVKSRGTLNCGVNNAVPGFGIVDPQGGYAGFDIEFCRVVAAAVLGDATKVTFKALTAEQRFTALQSREIDVLIRNTTWTATRDGNEGAGFVATTFYDGQGMMVRSNTDFNSIDDMDGARICVLRGTTTELNLESQFSQRNIDYTPRSFATVDEIRAAFTAGQCQGWTSDKSQLAGIRSAWPAASGGPQALRILEDTLSKEPLGPVVRDGDTDWFDAVRWAVLATILAEELEITKANVDQIRGSSTGEVRRLLGAPIAPPSPTASPTGASPTATATPAPFDPGLDLPDDWAYQIIKQVGNYAEIYNRTVGPSTPLGLARGVNALWTNGGLLYAPPYR
ncbi:MAG TPA: amino acid ABC transporter substrate-binding protein [Actinomycetota bacterium]|nr:amino acid ABC transporter substrate-binding protein [Actinomycetota bacterium]